MTRKTSAATTAFTAAAAALLLLAGCAGTSEEPEAQPDPAPAQAPQEEAPAAEAPTPTAEGNWGDVAGGEGPRLRLADRAIVGSDGCNQLLGFYQVDGASVTFSSNGGPGIASTRMACEGVDTWLSNAASGFVEGSTLTVQDAAGTTIGQLQRP